MADIKSLIDKFNIFRTKDSILNDVAKDNGQITIDIKQPFSDDIDSNNSLKTKLETNIKDKLFNTEINSVGSNMFDEKIKPFDKGYNVSNTPDTDTKTPIDTTSIKPDTPTIEKNTADATAIQQEKTQQPEITTPKPKQTQQYKPITEQQKPKLTTDSLGNPMPTNLPKKGTGWSGVGQQQIDDVFNLIKNDEEKFNMFQTYLSEAYNQLKSANLNNNENIIYVPFSYDHENGNMQGITLRFGLGQKEWAEKQLKILEKGITDKQNEEWLSNLELPQPETTMDKIASNRLLDFLSYMMPETNGMEAESKQKLEKGQRENRLNATKWSLIQNIKECQDVLNKYNSDKSQLGTALSGKNLAETFNNIILPQIDLVRKSDIADIVSKWKKNPNSLTPIEKDIVNYYSDYVKAVSVITGKTSIGYETVRAIEQSLPFMADFLRFNFVNAPIKAGAKAAMKIGGKSLAKQTLKDAPKTIGARGFRVADDILTAAGHTSVSPLTFTNMLEDYSQTMATNGQYTKNDLRRGVIEAFTENYSERMFGALKGIMPKSNNVFVKALFGNNPITRSMQKYMNVGGFVEEVSEEYAGAFLNTIAGFALNDKILAGSFKEQLNNSVPTILSIGITVGLPQAIGMGIDFREIRNTNKRFNVAEDNLKQYFNKENSYLDINRYSDGLKSLYINLNNAKKEEDKAEIKGKIAELNKTAANLAMEKGDSNGFNLISEYSIAAQNSFYVTNKAMSELKNMSEEDRTKLVDNAINKLKNDFTNNLNWSLISRAAAKNITDQNGKQHPTCFLYTDNGVTYVLNGQKDNMFYFVDVNGNTISKSADELRNNENLSVLHLNNLLSSFSNKELEDINSKFIDIAQYNAGYRYKVNDNGEIRYYFDNEDLINSNTPYEQIDRDKIESQLVGSYDLVRIDNITNAVEDMANAFAEPADEQTSDEQTSEQQPAQEPAQEQPIQEQTTEQEPIQQQQQEIEPTQQQIEPTQQEQTAQEEDDSTALNGVPDVVDDTPQDARERGFRRVNGYKIDRQKPLQAVNGKEIAVRFSNDVIANGHVAVIDAEQLQPSHIQGVRNPLHFIDEAQPKERNDEASIVSAQRIAKNIRPEEITSSVTAYTGAPIINARGETIQGNNRSDALRLMWSQNKDQAEKYKQYLIDHAQEFGLKAEDIAAMERPILVNMIDVSDEDAIALGQYVAQDTESGGLERIKPKNAVQKMGADMRIFANLLLSSNDDEISFAGLIDKNGVDVLNWLGQKGYITPTQYKSAFDTKGYITAEAKNDLRGIMYQSIFQGGSTRLEEMFNTMPAKAQKAILATAFRDYDSPKSESMIVEIQNSIRAYYALSQSADFMNAKTYKDVRLAVEGWKKQYQIDDATGESYLPAENFSNFALLLATMYKGEKQTLIQGTFNKLYDLIQGTQEADLFETPDNTPRTLSQAIKEVLNIDYNGQQRSNVLVGDTTTSQRGEQGSTRDAATRERTKTGERTTDSGRGTDEVRTEQQVKSSYVEKQWSENDNVEEMKQRLEYLSKATEIGSKEINEVFPEYKQLEADKKALLEKYNGSVPKDKEVELLIKYKDFIDRRTKVFNEISSLRDAIFEAEEKASIKAKEQAKQEKLDKIQNSYNGYLKGLSNFVASRIYKALSKKVNINGEVKTIAEFIEEWENNGNLKLEKEEFKPHISRSRWNKMDQYEQKEWEKAHEKGKTEYLVNGYILGKTAYDYANWLLSNKPIQQVQETNKLGKKSDVSVQEQVQTAEAALRDALIDKVREAVIDVITDTEEGQRVLDAANGNEIRQQKTTLDAVIEARDNEYLEAVRNGDLDKAQRMVVEAAKVKGYNSGSQYQGTSAFNGAAPWGNGYFLTKEERKEAWDNDEFDGDQTLGDYIHRGIDAMNLDFIALDPRHYRAADPMRKEAIDNVRNAIQKKSETITMYRSVPSDVKEGSFRNGDWVTPSRAYAVENAKVHGWGDNFNIIEQKVPVDEIWWDGNDIAEWGYGREEDFINDKDFAYKNTKNNRKLLDAVTYDDNGNVIPLSKRFNARKSDIRFFRTADGDAYGFTVGGKIYIDPRIANADTPIHEYAHLWASAMQKLNPNEWKNIVELMKGTHVWEEVKRNYPELTTDNEIADEVLAFYSGSRGAERLREEHIKILKGNGNVVDKVKAINAIKRVREALKRFWKNVAEWFGIHFTNAEEVADKVLSDLLNGVNPTLAGVENDIRFEENSEEAEIVARAKADGTYMKAPNGKQSNLSPRQWVQVRTKAFKDWFGDWENDPDNSSKVVDENGEPMVVYHGTKLLEMYFKDGLPYTKSIDRFYKFNDGKGFFTDNEKAAQTFATGQRGMYNTYLYINNPYLFDCKGQDWDDIKTYKDGETVSTDRIVYDAKQSGNYDGVILMNVGGENNGKIKEQINEAIPFSATQIKSATDNVGTFDKNNPDIRYQFVGEKGAAAMDKAEEATIRLDNLAVARDMEKAGKDAKDIKLATGWERGAEGKWRYEILDGKFDPSGELHSERRRLSDDEQKELDDAFFETMEAFSKGNDAYTNEITEDTDMADIYEAGGMERSKAERISFLEKKKSELSKKPKTLDDYIDNEELFAAYPELRDLVVEVGNRNAALIGSFGAYLPEKNIIRLNDISLSTLSHEVQHAIQDIEGFALGGSKSNVRDTIKKKIEELDNMSEYAKEMLARQVEYGTLALKLGNVYERLMKNGDELSVNVASDYYWEAMNTLDNDENSKLHNVYPKGKTPFEIAKEGFNREKVIDELKRLSDYYASLVSEDDKKNIKASKELSKKIKEKSNMELYRAIMGEVEARNVQSRLGMSAEERRRSLAIETEDVERKDQIFLEDGLGVSASEVDKETNDANRRASNRSVISNRFERQAEIQREEKNTKSAANIVLGNANVVLNDTNIFDEQYQNAIDNNLIDENVSPLIDSFGITWGYQLKNGVIVINKDVFVSDILDKRVKDNLSLLISSLMKTNKTFFKEGISFFKKLPIWFLYKNDTKSNEDTIKEIINDILLGNTSIDTNKLELLKQYTVQDMNDILDNATKWFEKFEGISSNMFAGNSISDILDTTLGDLMPKEITTTQEGKRLNWFSKLGIDIRSKLFDSLDWFRVVSDKTKDKTASELYDAMIVHTKRVQGKIDIFDKEYVRPIIDTIQSMLGKDFGNSTLSLDLIQEYFAIKSLLGRTASLYKERFGEYLANPEGKKPQMFDEFKDIYDGITDDEISQRIYEMGKKSSASILQQVDEDYLREEVRRTLAAEMFVKQYVYSSANTLNQGLQGEQSLGLINEVTNQPYSELYQLLYSDEQSSQTMHSPIEIIEQADILIDRAGLRKEFDFIGNQIQAILNYVNTERFENGLMSYETFAKRQLMKDFVNQRGENSSEGNLYEITAKQKANEKMKGKDWFNPNSITSIIAVAQTEIATMEKELLAQRLSYFLTNPNNFDVLSQYGMIIDEKETLNEELSEDDRNYIMDKNIVLLYGDRHTDRKINGKVGTQQIKILKRNDDGTFTKVTISFDNKFIGLEEFVKFVNNNFKYEELRGLSKAAAPLNAWLSRIYTILSPVFSTKNFFRDLMVTPWLPAKELNGKNSQYVIKNFYNAFNNLSFILKMSFAEKSFSKKGFENKLKARSQELFEYYLEYSKQHSIFSIEDQIGALSKENKTLQDIEKALSGKENKFIKYTERVLLIKFMQHYAELFENLHKFSAYVTLRKLGYGEERSAQIANNATLNYDRSGSIGRQLNAIIPFAKAALGGFYRTNYLLPKYNPKGFLQRVITLAVLGVMQGLMYDPDDDDISEFARKSGMVFGSFLYPLLPEELFIVRPVRALVIVMTGKKSPAYFKQELMESTIDLVPIASDALRGAFSYNPLTNKPEFDAGQLFANADKMTAFYALAMLASYINENKNSFGKNVLLNEETNTDKTRYGRTKQDYGLYDYIARLYNSILNGVDIDDRAAMSNKIGKNGERLMTIAKEDVEFVINNYVPFGRLYAYTAEIIYDAVNDKRINKGHIPLIGGLFAQKSFGKDYYLINNIKYELKDFTNDFSQSQIEDIKTNILDKAGIREGIIYKAIKDDNNVRQRRKDIAKRKMNDAYNLFILNINNLEKTDFTEDEHKFMLKSFLDSSIMKKALSIGEDTLNKHTAKMIESKYNRYKKYNNENIDTDKENPNDAVKKLKNELYNKSITEEEFNNKLNSLWEPMTEQIILRAKLAGFSINL